MGLFSKLFNKQKKINISNKIDQKEYIDQSKTTVNISIPNTVTDTKCIELIELNKYFDTILSAKKYIAKSDYSQKILDSKELIDYFNVLKSSNMLNNYCKSNGISNHTVEKVLYGYDNFEAIVKNHNELFIKTFMSDEKDYLDNILHEVDPNILLDDDQRRVVLTDEDHCLVIAGAGAGKTTTVAAKVKYLVERNEIDPKQILVISFTNKAVSELREKINHDLQIDCPIATFHSTGNAILRKQSEEKLSIVDSYKLYYVIQDYFKGSILKDHGIVDNLILFFASYFDAPYEGDDLNYFFNKTARSNFSTLRSDLNEFKQQAIDTRTKKMITINNEFLRSAQEVEIANFLYLNNIEYEYEPIYPYYIQNSKKSYTPDFLIKQGDLTAYIEHFGITQSGQNNRYSTDELNTYKNAINDKIKLHKNHNTALIYTFSSYNDGRPLTEHLKEQLEAKGFSLTSKSNKEILEKLISSEENRYIRKLVNLICRFISNFKTNGYTVDDFDRMNRSTTNVRSKLFLSICQSCFLEYERYLKEKNAVDFEDMINESARILKEVKEMKQKLDFKYIIVDEYQDISRQRFDLITALSDITDAKIIAVGDDWQSIYAFSGSDISLFTKFEEKMGYAEMLKIVKTYRNSQEVIDIAGNFIQKNDFQIKKELKSPKSITDPVIIYTYDNSKKAFNASNYSGANYNLAHAIETALKQIIDFNKQEGKPENSSILLLGRYGFDGDKLEKTGLFEYINKGAKIKSIKYPKLDITFMTVHAAKGLGYDNVIIINGKNETYGFPSKVEDDPVLAFVIKGDRSIDYAEERRLFYVAMTRTKNRVFCIAPQQNPSEFLLEIKKDYKNVVLNGNWNENSPTIQQKNICPICGYPLQLRYKNAYGLKLFICTNEPEICGFMTNELKAGKLSILKCDKCLSGYLIVKPGSDNGYFLGCTNYAKNGSGCCNTISKPQYYEMMHLSPDEPACEYHKEHISANSNEYTDQSYCSDKRNSTFENNNEKSNAHKSPHIVLKNACSNNRSTNLSVAYKKLDLYVVLRTILSCLVNISHIHFFGITTLTDVLRGSDSSKISSRGLQNVAEYGAFKSLLTREEIIFIIEWLIKNHYILQTNNSKYPVLHITNDGINYDNCISKMSLVKLQIKLRSTFNTSDSEQTKIN